MERRDGAFLEHLLCSRQDAQHITCHLVLINQLIDTFNPFFTNEETGAQRSHVICLSWLHSEEMAGF